MLSYLNMQFIIKNINFHRRDFEVTWKDFTNSNVTCALAALTLSRFP